MRVPCVNTTKQNVSYKAKVYKYGAIQEYMGYLNEHKNAPKDSFNTKSHITIFNKIVKALEQHPSKEEIYTDVKYRKNEMFNARGIISTSKGSLVDIEPARSDSGTAPVENIFRKFLDPQNKDLFNNVMGKEHSKSYDGWWKKNIKPIWGNIQKEFREETISPTLTDDTYNKMFHKNNVVKSNKTVSIKDKVLTFFNLS